MNVITYIPAYSNMGRWIRMRLCLNPGGLGPSRRVTTLLVLWSPLSFWFTVLSAAPHLLLNIRWRQLRRIGLEELQTSQWDSDKGTNYKALTFYSSRGQ